MRTVATFIMLFCASSSFAQEDSKPIHKGASEFGIFAAAGHSVPGGTARTTVFNAGIRYGKVLSRLHGPGILRGNFEYALSAMPLYLVHATDTRYAVAVDPVILKWNFTTGEHIFPYVEIGGGILLSRRDIPAGTSSVNFTPQANFGLQFCTQANHAVVIAAKYVHISNSGLASLNPGINTLQFSLGYHWFH